MLRRICSFLAILALLPTGCILGADPGVSNPDGSSRDGASDTAVAPDTEAPRDTTAADGSADTASPPVDTGDTVVHDPDSGETGMADDTSTPNGEDTSCMPGDTPDGFTCPSGQCESRFCHETACFDGEDNDGNDAIDCSDSYCRDNRDDCVENEGKQVEHCADGRDNDGDGKTDCQEEECDGLGCKMGEGQKSGTCCYRLRTCTAKNVCAL
mgnify:CR=1 FL=1